MLLGITDKVTGEKYNICGGFPSASGKTNLAMTLAPGRPGRPLPVEFYGDDIAWLWVNPDDGKVYGMNPEFESSVSPGHQREDEPGRAGPDPARQRRDLHQRRLQR